MCPVHWATFVFAAVPASLGILGYLGIRVARVGSGSNDRSATAKGE